MICFVCTLFANLALMHCWLMFASPLLHVWCILLCRALPEHWRVPTALESSETARKLDVPSAMFDIEQENNGMNNMYISTHVILCTHEIYRSFLFQLTIWLVFCCLPSWILRLHPFVSPCSPVRHLVAMWPERRWPIRSRIPQKPFVTWCALQRSSSAERKLGDSCFRCWNVSLVSRKSSMIIPKKRTKYTQTTTKGTDTLHLTKSDGEHF